MIDRSLPMPALAWPILMGLAGAGCMAFLAGLVGGIGPGWAVGLLALAGFRRSPQHQVLLVAPSLILISVYTQVSPALVAVPVGLALIGILAFSPPEGTISPAIERTAFVGVCLTFSVIGALLVDFSLGALASQLACVVLVTSLVLCQALTRLVGHGDSDDLGARPRGLGVEIF